MPGRPHLVLLVAALLLAGAAGARQARHLAFRKGSTFFYRLNYKANVLPYTGIVAQASGFKVAWELPTSRAPKALSGREAREGAELVYESHGFNGRMCLLKSLCQAADYVKERDGVLMKILHLLSGTDLANGTLGPDPLLCANYANHCPLHLIGLGAFAGH